MNKIDTCYNLNKLLWNPKLTPHERNLLEERMKDNDCHQIMQQYEEEADNEYYERADRMRHKEFARIGKRFR